MTKAVSPVSTAGPSAAEAISGSPNTNTAVITRDNIHLNFVFIIDPSFLVSYNFSLRPERKENNGYKYKSAYSQSAATLLISAFANKITLII
ncbi:hypothetical protein SDC9_192425 [bioreactor metagenome]|uniref:Uncharacterized protein n=1 Tax=bioreactor metagenome TaxID=1076179 RepID=A0A645I0T0_9ZZZZ